jgi:outer membrane lipoprotein-sorting protein
MMISRRFALAAVASLLAAAPLQAATAPTSPAPLSPEDQALVRRAAAYLDGLDTATGAFAQTTADGRQSSGTFWLQRPGRARFDYAPPSGLEIAADGHVVTVVDDRLKTIHSYPLGSTPLALFLARHVALDQGARVEAVEHAQAGFSIRVRGGRGAGRGSIALLFRSDPLALTGWAVTDARGSTVRVTLSHFEPSAPKPADFFVLRAPASSPHSQPQ